ncbi:MAG TPA: PPOX class F420-dependent oxidoreductase [Mycobacteriales bacterium]
MHPAGRGILATIKRDGRPQLSNVAYAWDGTTVRVSVTDDRAKTHNMRRDPRVALEVTTPDLGGYVVVEGEADLTPVAAEPYDATVDELVDVFRAIGGEHDDWDDYRAAMVRDRRLVLRLRPTHSYGWAP